MAILSLEQFLQPDTQPRPFVSKIWGGELMVRPALVEDREAARVAAKADGAFNNIVFQTKLLAACIVEPKIPELEIDRLRKKSTGEVERLLKFILGESEENPR